MAPTGQGSQWSDVLCCTLCTRIFDRNQHQPINLACGHVVCRKCADNLDPKTPCPHDEAEAKVPINSYPVNVALLSIIHGEPKQSSHSNQDKKDVENSLISLASHLKKTESERGGSVYSQKLSRMLQRKLVSLLCYQYEEEDGRSRALKACRAMAERIMSEVLLSFQSSAHVSSELWTAVRSRGCQFLGPAMQDDVLKLIMITLENGALIARKTLVMYVVTMLTTDYPQVSKTCVGHVVQLLYRASCFNVIKRDGESSLMQLKEEFRTYESLRREHDAQIVQMAMEAGLRISPDQWSALLYADQAHRSHMQSIIDKLQSMTSSFKQNLEEMLSAPAHPLVGQMLPLLKAFEHIHPTHYEKVNISQFREYLRKVNSLIGLHVSYEEKRKEDRLRDGRRPERQGFKFKTKMCTSIQHDGKCARGTKCNYAHSSTELRTSATEEPNPPIRQPPQAVPVTMVAGPPKQQQQPPPPQMAPTPHQPPPPQPPPPQMVQQQIQMPLPPTYLPPPTMVQHHHHHPHHHPPPWLAHHHQPPPPPPPQAIVHHPHFPRGGMPPRFNGTPDRPQPPMTPMTPMAIVGYQPNQPPPPLVHQQQQPLPPPPPLQQQQQQQHQPPQQPPQLVQMMPVLMPSPTHNKTPQMVMVPSDSPMVAAVAPAQTPPAPHPSTLWASPTQLLIPSSPPHQQMWIQNQSIFPVDPFDGAYIWSNGAGAAAPQDADQLIMKRNEIINRLGPISIDEDDGDDNGISHVSYTVASSVLDDSRVEMHPFMMVKGQTFVNFGPIPNEETMTMIGEMVQRPRAGSLTQGPLIPMESPVTTAPPVEPIVTCPPPEFQQQPQVLVDGSGNILTPVIHQIIMTDPQGLVSNSLDKIVDVKERLCEAEAGSASEAVSEHLRMELRMAESEMEHLDPRTKTSCLLRELQQVDMELHQLQFEERT